MSTITNDVSLEELIYRLIDVNKANLDRFIDLLTALEGHITDPATAPYVQGELATLLQEIMLNAMNSIGQVLGLAEALQTGIVESFFPVP